jgi:hypothetical protein
MTANTPQLCSVASRKRARALLVCCLCAWPFIGGCSARKNTPNRWRGAGMMRPAMPATVAPRPRPLPEESVDPVPELRLEIPPPPPLLAVRSTPPRPRVAPAPTTDNGAAAKPEVPVIAPQLSAAESSAAQQQMTSSLAVAEKNLAYSQGKKLNATQTDLAAKVKEFVDDARAAARDGDWTRARSLATKAQVLSEELAASL